MKCEKIVKMLNSQFLKGHCGVFNLLHLSNRPKPQDIQFTLIYDKEKQNIIT